MPPRRKPPSRSKSWIQKHTNDKFYKRAKLEGFRARSAYKLLQIIKRYPIFSINNRFPSHIVDLGCSPGSWLEVTIREYNSTTLQKDELHILGVDLTDIRGMDSTIIEFFRCDILKPECENKIKTWSPTGFDVLLSDCAPRTSGNATDVAIQEGLVERALELALKYLRPHGNIVIKVFQSGESQQFIQKNKSKFRILKYSKPEASTSASREIFLVGIDYQI